jgi:phenylalanyl-tRNA synthetase beta chain
MRITLACLKEFVDLQLSCQKIAEILTSLGMEVDKIENEKPSFDGVICGFVEECNKHPNADKLSVAKVTDGKNSFQVVCGAPNCRKGIKTAFAKIGATLDYGKKKIGPAKIRDIESFGMLASFKELNLFDDSSGILELDDSIPLGTDLKTIVDPVFEISLTPNLGHLLSALGMARELAAFLNKKIKISKITLSEDKKLKPHVIIEDDTLCPRYSVRLMQNVGYKATPFWLKYRLEACGIKSINTIVDITNYTMLMLGQPMHAFDYDLIHGKVRVAIKKPPITFTGLDNVERKLEKPALFIQDDKNILALAGVIGLKDSAINDNTKNIFLESAYFEKENVQKTAKAIDLKTQSSMRFEKGCDPEMTEYGLDFASNLLKKLFPEAVIGQKEDIRSTKLSTKVVKCRASRTNRLLGTTLSIGEIENIFTQLGFETMQSNADVIEVKIPLYRHDINIEADLIEEVARIYGYNNIVKKSPLCRTSTIAHAPMYLFENLIKQRLFSQGMQEFVSCDLISPSLAKTTGELNLNKDDLIEVLKTKSQDFSILRPTLFPSFLNIVKYNHDHGIYDIAGFEVSRVHLKQKDKYTEHAVVALITSGRNKQQFWQNNKEQGDFFDLKGILENLFSSLKIEKITFNPSKYLAFHAKRQADIVVGENKVGVIGQVSLTMAKNFDIKKDVFFAEINLNELFKLHHEQGKVKDLCPYPASSRDWTIKVKKEISFNHIINAIYSVKSSLLETVFLVDIFELDNKENNFTIHFIYRNKDKTLLFEDAEEEHNRIIKEVTSLIFS